MGVRPETCLCNQLMVNIVRRPPSPASPQPYVAKPAQEPSVFPPADANAVPLTAHDLLGYIREHNRERGAKLQIWLKTAAEAKSDRPQLLRFMIPDVVIVYISVSYERTSGAVVIENMAAFGPREKVGPSTADRGRRGTDFARRKPPTSSPSTRYSRICRSSLRGCCIRTPIFHFRV